MSIYGNDSECRVKFKDLARAKIYKFDEKVKEEDVFKKYRGISFKELKSLNIEKIDIKKISFIDNIDQNDHEMVKDALEFGDFERNKPQRQLAAQ